MLVNDPPLPDPADPASLDASVFGGKAMTYYGRWTYKFEQAAKMGAAGCFVIHETGPAGYGWEVVSGSWSKEQFDLVNPDGNMSRCAIEGWLTTESATRLFAQAGLDFEEMKKAAVSRDFQPTPLNTQASIALTNEIGQLDSHNIMAKVEGSDPELKDEYVIYTAHWDHLGLDPSLEGDQIFNGAQDNASGTGALIELAEAFLTSPEPPKRSILLMAVTAEEKGLLGSKYYAENPIYPLVKTVAVINMDMVNVFGETKDLIVIGHGNSELDDLTEAAAQEQGRIVKPDSEPEKGFFYRSDHFSFTKQGVPALYAKGGLDYIGQPEGWGKEKKDEYTRLMYHKVADEYDPEWTFIGAVQDLNLLFNVGLQLATQDAYPKWKPGTEFKALREQMLQEAGIDKD
jgi:Zn-dependent M28 family amino/carboxypeptidase